MGASPRYPLPRMSAAKTPGRVLAAKLADMEWHGNVTSKGLPYPHVARHSSLVPRSSSAHGVFTIVELLKQVGAAEVHVPQYWDEEKVARKSRDGGTSSLELRSVMRLWLKQSQKSSITSTSQIIENHLHISSALSACCQHSTNINIVPYNRFALSPGTAPKPPTSSH